MKRKFRHKNGMWLLSTNEKGTWFRLNPVIPGSILNTTFTIPLWAFENSPDWEEVFGTDEKLFSLDDILAALNMNAVPSVIGLTQYFKSETHKRLNIK